MNGSATESVCRKLVIVRQIYKKSTKIQGTKHFPCLCLLSEKCLDGLFYVVKGCTLNVKYISALGAPSIFCLCNKDNFGAEIVASKRRFVLYLQNRRDTIYMCFVSCPVPLKTATCNVVKVVLNIIEIKKIKDQF